MKLHALLLVVAVGLTVPRNGAGVGVGSSAAECNTAEWWQNEVDVMASHIDRGVRPCDDFYEYACGNWRVSYRLRALHARDTLSALKADNKRLLMQYFKDVDGLRESQEQHVALKSHERIVVNFYHSCVDAMSNTNITAYTSELKEIANWPILDPHWMEPSSTAANALTPFNWEYVSAALRRYGVQSLWQLLVQPNWQSADQRIFYITAPSFDLLKPSRHSSTYDDNSVFLYHRYIKYLMLELKVRVRQAIQIAVEVISFEKQLMSFVTNDDSLVLQAPQTLAALQRQLPDLNLRKYFETLLQGLPGGLPPDYEEKLLIVADTAYLRKLANFMLLAKPETVGKYLLVQFLAHFEVLFAQEITNEQEYCLQKVHKYFPAELSAVFLEQQHPNSTEFMQRTQQQLNGHFALLKVQFEKVINSTSVFQRDALTKVLGLEKLRAMRLLLPNLQSSATYSTDFEPLTDNYDQNLLDLSKLRTQHELAVILEVFRPPFAADSDTSTKSAVTWVDSSYGPLDVNAYYRLKKNAIEIPVGILRTPLYSPCYKPAKLFGSFIYILAHELLHGFDYDGLNYDKSGNVANDWGVKSIISFGVKSSCYLSERYTNAALTINENIADSEGLRLALETFLLSASHELTPATAENSMKLFFLSFAQTWCGTSMSVTKADQQHASHRERVNSVLGNFPEFADIFKCDPDSPMNPAEKCRVW